MLRPLVGADNDGLEMNKHWRVSQFRAVILAASVVTSGCSFLGKKFGSGGSKSSAPATQPAEPDAAQSPETSGSQDTAAVKQPSDSDGGQADQGMTSDVHKQHVGKIVFAGSEIGFAQEDPAAFKDSFKLGEGLYGRFYLAKSLRAEAKARGWTKDAWTAVTIVASVNGTRVKEDTWGAMEPHWTTFRFALSRGDGDMNEWKQLRWFLNGVAAKLKPGTHKISFEVFAAPSFGDKKAGVVVATGGFKLTVPAAAAAKKKIAAANHLEDSLFPKIVDSGSSSESAGDKGYRFQIESECEKFPSVRVTHPSGATINGVSGGTSVEYSGELPASVCIDNQGVGCVGRSVELSASTRKVRLPSNCVDIVPM